MAQPDSVSVVIPAYNEAAAIADVVHAHELRGLGGAAGALGLRLLGREHTDLLAHAVLQAEAQAKKQAEAEGLAKIFTEAGFEWRDAGCSMCLAMNEDILKEGERCASTSNRNFAGRQGPGARTHLMSPAMAAAAAINGRLTDVREMIA